MWGQIAILSYGRFSDTTIIPVKCQIVLQKRERLNLISDEERSGSMDLHYQIIGTGYLAIAGSHVRMGNPSTSAWAMSKRSKGSW